LSPRTRKSVPLFPDFLVSESHFGDMAEITSVISTRLTDFNIFLHVFKKTSGLMKLQNGIPPNTRRSVLLTGSHVTLVKSPHSLSLAFYCIHYHAHVFPAELIFCHNPKWSSPIGCSVEGRRRRANCWVGPAELRGQCSAVRPVCLPERSLCFGSNSDRSDFSG